MWVHNEGWEAVQERRYPNADAVSSAHHQHVWRGVRQPSRLPQPIVLHLQLIDSSVSEQPVVLPRTTLHRTAKPTHQKPSPCR
ncbi:hypothetical protein M3J09_001527 [Ascochyta lentis]